MRIAPNEGIANISEASPIKGVIDILQQLIKPLIVAEIALWDMAGKALAPRPGNTVIDTAD